eukprot:CAMPEP_0176066108 /NCGR_PEP_ID=MMETSP0120_2-20121206/32988_1 /TAXON_ID=160619 /ORGANISM="Kryptoperidinium foliaceum, Strain CCMP 1326" /LENGTH=205 /DNA_ID=CAMNT_0017399709 /DNA_START=29 /DNA_END=648 /DNA_ORIENTATION=-
MHVANAPFSGALNFMAVIRLAQTPPTRTAFIQHGGGAWTQPASGRAPSPTSSDMGHPGRRVPAFSSACNASSRAAQQQPHEPLVRLPQVLVLEGPNTVLPLSGGSRRPATTVRATRRTVHKASLPMVEYNAASLSTSSAGASNSSSKSAPTSWPAESFDIGTSPKCGLDVVLAKVLASPSDEGAPSPALMKSISSAGTTNVGSGM